MEETRLQDLMTYRLVLSPRSSEGFSPNRRARFKSISVVSPGSILESDQVRARFCCKKTALLLLFLSLLRVVRIVVLCYVSESWCGWGIVMPWCGCRLPFGSWYAGAKIEMVVFFFPCLNGGVPICFLMKPMGPCKSPLTGCDCPSSIA